MTAGLLDLAELAAESGVPVLRLRHYAGAGLLPAAQRDGDRIGYPSSEVGNRADPGRRRRSRPRCRHADGTGLRLEIRMPGDAAGTLAAVVGLPDTPVGRKM